MAKFEAYSEVTVGLAPQYPIIICANAVANPNFWHSLVPSRQVLIVSNVTVAPIYLSSLQAHFTNQQCDTVILEDGEAYKNQHSLFIIYDKLVQKKHHKDTMLLALGGGVVGDITGFAAATYQRGVPFIQIPTTLLAQVDASVGGKTAINHPSGKNMIGSFYQPQAVVVDLATLKTLPEREFRSGLAEVIKYGLLEGGVFFNTLYTLLKRGLTCDSVELPQLISQCCQIKARFVARDEREQGVRALLNLGHTFAHALEAATGYQRWLHGEAVGIGLYCAALLSFELGLLNASLVSLIKHMLQWAGLPHKIPAAIDCGELMRFMSLDKKIRNGCLRFVVINQPGDCSLHEAIPQDCLDKVLAAALQRE